MLYCIYGTARINFTEMLFAKIQQITGIGIVSGRLAKSFRMPPAIRSLCMEVKLKEQINLNNDYTIRLETENDYREVENLTREAFRNVYKPGCDEHYFVHMMRSHPDFIPDPAFVVEKDGKIIGNIMYTKAWLRDEEGNLKEILSLFVFHDAGWRKDTVF